MPTNTTLNQYEIVSDEIQEIIGQIPPWIVRWGISIMMTLLIIFLAVGYFIQYPTVLNASTELFAKEQPFKLSWYRTEQYMAYYSKVQEGQLIKKGDTLLVEQNLQTHVTSSILAPFGGRVAITKGYKDRADKQTIWIVPSISDYEVLLKIPIKKSGKVKVGQEVNISLDEYPANEFGFLSGKVTSIVPIKIEGNYRINVSLTRGLKTNRDINIPAQPSFSGQAEIISDRKSVVQRIFGGLL